MRTLLVHSELRQFVWVFAAAIVLLACSFEQAQAAKRSSNPNVIIIMADDLGYSDLGCYGSEIQTPNLDELAANGLKLTQFYNTARCWPTRAVLMTGYYAQQVGRDKLPGGGGGGGNRNARPKWARLLPDMLRPAGYRSYHSGKWHIDGMPIAAGFDRSYLLKDQGRFFNPTKHWEDDQLLPPVKKDSGFYGTIAIADHAIKCLQEHQADHADKPFFHYLAFTAPHFPLHALPEDIAKYRDRYLKGWKAVRQKRYHRQKTLGLLNEELSAVETELGPPYHFPDHLKILGNVEVNRPVGWETLTPEQQTFQATKMAIHAAMVDRVDQEIGRVLAQLKQMSAFDNTLIFFLSDNGASAEIMVRDDGHDRDAPMGSAATYLCLGPGWSTTCNTPFRRHKTWVHEGGISTPLVMHWPAGIQAKGEQRRGAGHVIDIVPTILDVCGADRLREWEGTPVPPPPGKSLRPMFESDATIGREHLWWFHDAHKAIRQGDWKLVAAKGEPWELYDLSTDRTEQSDLADEQSERVKKMAAKWEELGAEFRATYEGKQRSEP